jgi:hypothetical protein
MKPGLLQKTGLSVFSITSDPLMSQYDPYPGASITPREEIRAYFSDKQFVSITVISISRQKEGAE